jgi:hypothetical protein
VAEYIFLEMTNAVFRMKLLFWEYVLPTPQKQKVKWKIMYILPVKGIFLDDRKKYLEIKIRCLRVLIILKDGSLSGF